MSETPRRTPSRQVTLNYQVVKRLIEKSPTKQLSDNANVLDSIENSPRKRRSDDEDAEATSSSPGSGSKRSCSQSTAAVTPINFYRSSTSTIRTPASELVNSIGNSVRHTGGIQTPATLPAVSGPRSSRLAVKSRQRLKFESDEADEDKSEHDTLNAQTLANLSSGLPDRLVCRDKELDKLKLEISTLLDAHKSGSFYISGLPGTGKTACLKFTLEELKSSTLYGAIYKAISGKTAKIQANILEHIERTIQSQKQMCILVLDEVDQLKSKQKEVLKTIFHWPLKSSNLILIGVSNQHDLIDQIPQLKLKPKLIHFEPYTKEDIAMILEDRLQQAASTFFEPAAIKICAAKVSKAVLGDARKALDICRGLLRRQQLEQYGESSSDALDSTTPSRVAVKDVLKAVGEIYSAKTPNDLPLQQKLVLASMLRLAPLLKKNGKALDKSVVLAMYNHVCREKGMETSGSDFADILDRLETQGLISLERGKGEKSPGRRRTKAIASPLISTKCWITIKDETFVRNSLKDEALISSVLSMNLAELKFIWQ